MKILLAAINAKYIHSNPAIYSLRAYVEKYQSQIELGEYTINQQTDEILEDIYRRKPDIIAFSCYIWNVEKVRELTEQISLVLPRTLLWAGGPEVSYHAADFLRDCPQMAGIMRGEGERTFARLAAYYLEGVGALEEIAGITYRDQEGEVRKTPPGRVLSMDEIPFLYGDLKEFTHRIIYYESSRGCPFSCSYCLSSIDKRVRFRSLPLVKRELQVFLDEKVPQVKFVDRTFNCNHAHAMEIWRYIREHDNGVTNFHFEIAADLLTEEEIALLATLRPGLVQLEIGVQSTNPVTIREINRKMDLPKLRDRVERIREGKNIHQHLDLIAGLPGEDLESFRRSFNQVYAMRPHQLQLGFLKVLKGSSMEERAAEYGTVYRPRPPYEVLSTRWISYGDLLELKGVEEMVEVYYNSGQFARTIEALSQAFADAYSLYRGLAQYYQERGWKGQNHSRMKRLEILRQFALETDGTRKTLYERLLLEDLYLRENSKSRPNWAMDLTPYKDLIAHFYKEEAQNRTLLPGYEGYGYRQLRTMTHLELFVREEGGLELVLFDYQRRNPLTQDAWTYRQMLTAPENMQHQEEKSHDETHKGDLGSSGRGLYKGIQMLPEL